MPWEFSHRQRHGGQAKIMPHICAALKFADAADVPVVIPLAVGVWHVWPEDEPIKGLLVARSKGGYKKMGRIVRYECIIKIY